jgi:hypothetical protein
MKGAKGNAEQSADERHDALLRPMVGGKPMRSGALLQALADDVSLLGTQTRRSSWD